MLIALLVLSGRALHDSAGLRRGLRLRAPDAENLAVSAAVMVWIVKEGREDWLRLEPGTAWLPTGAILYWWLSLRPGEEAADAAEAHEPAGLRRLRRRRVAGFLRHG